MKSMLTAIVLLTSFSTFANPLLLKCTINKKLVVLNVEPLTGSGCHNAVYNILNGQIKSRYNVTLCDSDDATGTLEVQTARGEWIETEVFSTPSICYTWREIATVNTGCRRYGHNQNCVQ